MSVWQRLKGLWASGESGTDDRWRWSPEQLEEALILADAGLELAEELSAQLARAQSRGLVAPGQERQFVEERLVALFPPLALPPPVTPHVILLVGTNGSGKTTTAAKLAARIKKDGGKPILAACDTFRAAAVEQLQLWGERIGVEVVAQRPGADPGAVLFDALQAARSRGASHLVADTAGRLHTKHNLMHELAKLVKVARRAVRGAPHEVLLVMDASTGHNGLVQARQFRQHAPVTALVLTKLDGSAKGGVVLAVARELALPVRWVGLGERVEDLHPFDPREFVRALVGEPAHV